MSFQQFLLILRARWKVMFAVFASVVAVAVVLSLVLPKKYLATAAVVLDAKPDPILGAVLPGQLAPGYMATQVDIVTSDRVAQRVVKMLKLDLVPEFREQWLKDAQGRGVFEAWLADLLSRGLDVKPSRESNVISINFKWADPKGAAALANAFAQAYIDTSLEIKVEPAKQYAIWFEARTKSLREELDKAQRRLSDYQREHGIVASDERLDVENARLAELSSQLVSVQAVRSESASRQKQASGSINTSPDVLQSPLVQQLRADVARSEAKLKDLGGQIGQNHPQYQRAQAELAELKAKLDVEMRQVASAMGTTNQVNVQREAEIRGALEAQKRRVLETKQQRDELTVLQNDVATAQRNLDMVSQRLVQSNLESQTLQTNIVVLSPANEPADPSSPKLLLNIVLSVFLGSLLSIATALLLELMNRRVRSAEDLVELLQIPVLTVVGRASANTLSLPRSRS